MGQSQPTQKPVIEQRIWDLHRIEGHQVGRMSSLLFDETTQELLVGCDDSHIAIFDLNLQNKTRHVYLNDIFSITSMAVLNEKKYLIGTSYGDLKTVSRDSFQVLESSRVSTEQITSLSVSADSNLILMGTNKGSIALLTANRKKEKLSYKNNFLGGNLEVAFSPDSNYVVGSAQGHLLLIIEVKRTNTTCMYCETLIKGFSFADGSSTVMVLGEGALFLIDISKQEVLKKAYFNAKALTAKLHSQSRLLASASDGKVHLWKVNKDLSFEQSEFAIDCDLAFTPDKIVWSTKGKHLALLRRFQSNALQVMDVESRKAIISVGSLPSIKDFHNFVMSADGKLLLIFYHERKMSKLKLFVVDIATSRTIQQLCLNSDAWDSVHRIKFLGKAERSCESSLMLKALGECLIHRGSTCSLIIYDVIIGQELSLKIRGQMDGSSVDRETIPFSDRIFLLHNNYQSKVRICGMKSSKVNKCCRFGRFYEPAISLDSRFIAFATKDPDHMVAVGDLQTTRVLTRIPLPGSFFVHAIINRRTEFCRNRLLVVGRGIDKQDKIIFIDAVAGKVVHEVSCNPLSVDLKVLSPSHEKIAYVGPKGAVYVVDLVSGKQVFEAFFEQGIVDLAFSVDGKLMIVAKDNGSIKFVRIC